MNAPRPTPAVRTRVAPAVPLPPLARQAGLVPTANDVVIDKRTYAAPMSYVGSARRIISFARKNGAAGTVFAIIAIPLAWSVMSAWYLLIFGVFGIFVIPYRLLRRGQRKNLHIQQTQLAAMQAMIRQQNPRP
ncbi:MAG: hypothetical protein ACYDCC_13365 [Actinomycetota bacterium]